jgi:hypothetical protein
MEDKEHTYPKDKKPEMKAVKPEVSGKTESKTTENGPHLLTGKGTKYNHTKLGKGFMVCDTRPGHTQKKNIESEEHY